MTHNEYHALVHKDEMAKWMLEFDTQNTLLVSHKLMSAQI